MALFRFLNSKDEEIKNKVKTLDSVRAGIK